MPLAPLHAGSRERMGDATLLSRQSCLRRQGRTAPLLVCETVC